MAREADYGMLLARTDFDVPKHAGISWFAFPLDQPGVTIRPLREMTGDAVFNEVFLDDAVCDDADLIGGAGQRLGGHADDAVLRAHRHRRRRRARGLPGAGPEGRHARPARRRRRARPVPGGDLVVALADLHRAGPQRTAAPTTRTSARSSPGCYAYIEVGQWNAQRAKAEAAQGGGAGDRQHRQDRADAAS